MNPPQPHHTLTPEIIEQVLVKGDLAKLTEAQRVSYYTSVCTALGLNPTTQPFAYITLNGKLTLYARKDATDQLRKIHHISIMVTKRERQDDIYITSVKAKNHGGREDESTGAVNIKGLTGDALANAIMKSETKAKRRATLSICGLGFLDETEIETVKEARPYNPEIKAQTAIDAAIRPVEKPQAQARHTNYGEHVIRIGKKYVGQKISNIHREDLIDFVDWINKEANETFTNSPDAQEFLFYAENYLAENIPEEEWSELDQTLNSKLKDPKA